MIYFNSRPREGGDGSLLDVYGGEWISIRAPARGATAHIAPEAHVLLISIRAPARGATRGPLYHKNLKFISIRAPARGATA